MPTGLEDGSSAAALQLLLQSLAAWEGRLSGLMQSVSHLQNESARSALARALPGSARR